MSDETRVDGVETVDDKNPEAPVYLWCDGQRYELSGLEPEDFAACRDRLKQRLADPIDALTEALEGLNGKPAGTRDQIKKELIDRAYRDIRKPVEDRVPTGQEISDWVDNTESGALFTMFLMLKRKTPDITEARVAEVLKAVGKAEFVRKRAEASKKLIEKAQKLAN